MATVSTSDDLDECDAKRDAAAFRDGDRKMSALVARRKFYLASQPLADQKVLPVLSDDANDLDVLDRASTFARARDWPTGKASDRTRGRSLPSNKPQPS
jgi:hypothetical protein